MGPAILLCPSSSAVQLWGQVSPLKKTRQKEGGITLSHSCLRCSANAQCTGDFGRRQAFFLHPASSFEKCRRISYPFAWRRVSAAASGDEVSVEEAAIAVSDEVPTEQSESSDAPTTGKEGAPVATEGRAQARRTLNRSNSNANKAAVVSPAELLPGAVFPGKVTSIQTYGAFVDFGAFTNGLVHISRLSKSYVKTVEDVVQVGQDVKVQVLEVDLEANRISLMLVQEGKEEAPQEGEAAEKSSPRPSQQQARTPRRESSKRQPSQRQTVTTTMKKGEIAMGTVKNMIKSGVFITLPDGTDGYLPAAEVVFKGPNTNMEAQFQIGQEVNVRVLRIEKGRVNLTMKREVNFDKLNEDLNKDVVGEATNPFEIAFRRNQLIASFLADRDKQKVQAEAEEGAKKGEAVNSAEEVKDVVEVEKPAKEEVEDKVVNGVDASKGEAVSSEAVDSAEAGKAVVESEKPAVEEEEKTVASRADAREEEPVLSEAVNSAEEAKAVVGSEKLAVEEEEKVFTNGVDARKDEPALSKAVDSVEEVKTVDEVAKPSREEEEAKVVIGADAMKDDDVSSEAVNSVEEVKGASEVEEQVVEKEEEKVADAVEASKDEAMSSEAINPVEEVKDAAEVEKPIVEKENENVGDGAEAMKIEALSPEDAKDTAEVEKPAADEKEEKVANADAAKGGTASSEADAQNVITLV